MLTLMAMSFSTVSSVSTGPFFIYLLYLFIHLFSPQNDDIFYVIRNSIFYLLKYLWNLIELESNLNNWAKCYWDLSLKKKCIVLKGKKLSLFQRNNPVIEQVQFLFYPCFLGKYIQKCKNAKNAKTSWKI